MSWTARIGRVGALLLLGGCTGDTVAPVLDASGDALTNGIPLVGTDVVTDLRRVVVTDTLVLLGWTEVDDGTGAPADYRVKYGAPPLDDWKSATIGCDRWIRGKEVGRRIFCEVEGLEPETAYGFQLMSYRLEDGQWAGARYSNAVEATTLQKRTDPVTDLAAEHLTTESVKLIWTQVDDGTGEPAFYRVRYGPHPMVPWRSGKIGCDRTIRGDAIGAEINCIIDGLEPGVEYDFLLMSFRMVNGVWEGARYSNKLRRVSTAGG